MFFLNRQSSLFMFALFSTSLLTGGCGNTPPTSTPSSTGSFGSMYASNPYGLGTSSNQLTFQQCNPNAGGSGRLVSSTVCMYKIQGIQNSSFSYSGNSFPIVTPSLPQDGVLIGQVRSGNLFYSDFSNSGWGTTGNCNQTSAAGTQNPNGTPVSNSGQPAGLYLTVNGVTTFLGNGTNGVRMTQTGPAYIGYNAPQSANNCGTINVYQMYLQECVNTANQIVSCQ